jgi:predicted DNA-binding transcriptional regulator YafY
MKSVDGRPCDQLVRTLGLLSLLAQGGRFTLEQLADKFGVCQRTIRRDLHALEAAGFAIGKVPDTGEGRRGEWWLERAPGWLGKAIAG